jgi:hypothetical protein
MQKLNCLATFMMHDSLLNFHSVFLDTLYMTKCANSETFEEFRASATIPEGKRGRITWITP